MFFHVINHYQPRGAGPHVVASTVLAASLARRSPLVASVLVVDGSAAANPELARQLAEAGADYLHAGRELGFAEAYNLGLSHSDQPWTVLAASDIYPSPELFDVVAHSIVGWEGKPIGCVIPQLSVADLSMQEYRGLLPPVPIIVPLMTLNFNAFPSDYLRAIGGVPDRYSGGYNDAVLAWRMRQDGRAIVMAPTCCAHFGGLTLEAGKTSVNFARDQERFQADYPELVLTGGIWDLDLTPFATSRPMRWAGQAVRHFPELKRQHAQMRVLRWMLKGACGIWPWRWLFPV